MSKKSDWLSGLAINLVSNLIALIVGGIVTYFSHEGSAWVKPLLFGGAAWLITFCSILAIRFMSRLPKKSDPVTQENIGRKIRDWLDEFNLTVKSVHDPDSDFFFIVTTDGGKKISISRSIKQFSDHLFLKALVNPSDEEKKLIEQLSSDEKIDYKLAMQLELSRAIIGYKTDNFFEGLTIFKRIPITSTLTAEEILNGIWEVEAMLTSIFVMGASSIHRHNVNRNTNGGDNEVGVQKGEESAKELRGYDDKTLSLP